MDFLTIFVFAGYLLFLVSIGLIASRKGQKSADDYFLAGRKLPWYAIGLSMVGANTSTVQLIGTIGAAYVFGICPANWEMIAFISMSLLMFLFLPYYLRSKLYTIPKFLEDRYNHVTRLIFAIFTVFYSVAVILAGSLYAGGLIFQDIFSPEGVTITGQGNLSQSLILGIIIISLTTGIYCIYGGLTSVVWTDVVQVTIMFLSGIAVSIAAVKKAGGWHEMWAINELANNAKVHLIQSPTNSFAPWTGIITLFLSLGVWYNCTNQFYIQKCFGAKDEWHARMGVTFAAFIKQFMPLVVVVPGLAAFAIYNEGLNKDKVFLQLVQDLMSPLMKAVVLTVMVASIMSAVSAVLNSCSTIFTIDIYQRYFKPQMTQSKIVQVGRLSSLSILVVATIWAPFILFASGGLFIYIQDLAAYFAPPIAVIFLSAVFWRRANAVGANATLIGGLLMGLLLKVSVTMVPQNIGAFISPFLNRAFICWLLCIGIMIIASLNSKAGAIGSNDIIWKPSYAKLPKEVAAKYTGFRTFLLWWTIVLAVRIVIYIKYA